MSQSSRAGSAGGSAPGGSGGDTGVSASNGKWTRIIIAAGVALAIVAITLVALFSTIRPFYPYNQAPFRRTVVSVDDVEIRMDYFIKMSKLSGADPFTMLDTLSRQLIMKIEAPSFGIEVTPEEIDQELKRQAQGTGDNMTDAEFREWYRQKLNDTELTDSEFREIGELSVIANRMQEILAAQVPTTAEQVHLYALFLPKQEDVQKARDRWEAGESFSDLVAELSDDPDAVDAGGELGWFPQGVLASQFEFEAFELNAGEVSEPFPVYSNVDVRSQQAPELQGWALFWVKERTPDRELDENALSVVRAAALDKWLSAEIANHTVKYGGLTGAFDTETYTWINYQLAKDKPSTTSGGN